MKSKKEKILVSTPYFLPYTNFGGGCKTIVNQYLHTFNDYDYTIFTRSYQKINTPRLNQKGIYYFKNYISLLTKAFLIDLKKFKRIQFNSFFSPFTFFMLAAFFFKKTEKKILIFPRGELLQRNLAFKKRIYIKFINFYAFFKNISLVATSQIEYDQLSKIYKNINIMQCSDFLDVWNEELKLNKFHIDKKKIKLIFISNFYPNKNIIFLINIIKNLPINFVLDIYGNSSDQEYLSLIAKEIKNLDLTERVSLNKAVPNEKVIELFSKYNAFIFPTLSENFGYVVYESMRAGCIPIIANTTPWQFPCPDNGLIIDINKNAFYWSEQIIKFFKQDELVLKTISENSKNYARFYYKNISAIRQLNKIFS
tara:strand:+ start:7358 stop:8458 length:1101 start_codon:yes stop_codon:yes gene_type:complete